MATLVTVAVHGGVVRTGGNGIGGATGFMHTGFRAFAFQKIRKTRGADTPRQRLQQENQRHRRERTAVKMKQGKG